ncbi:MAG: C39 family peptidase [Opitutales bacterium]
MQPPLKSALGCVGLVWALVWGSSLFGATYAPLALPDTLKIKELTPVFDPQDASNKLGDFRPGIEVNILERQGGFWLAEYERPMAENIRVLIEVPNLAERDPERFQAVERRLEQFPLLKKMLTAEAPWPDEARLLAQSYFSEPQERLKVRGLLYGDASEVAQAHIEAASEDGKGVLLVPLYHRTSRILEVEEPERLVATADTKADASVFGIEPLQAQADFTSAGQRRITIELWNKTDGSASGYSVDAMHDLLRENLEALQEYFYPEGLFERDPEGVGITALNQNLERFFLCNDVRADLRYERGEYLILDLGSYVDLRRLAENPLDIRERGERMAATVKTHPEGFVYIEGVPMIDQGEKGYCAAATVARTLQHYGYAVDMHSLAKLADTDYHGTTVEDLYNSMRRISNGTPFRLNALSDGRRMADEIQEAIERGQPVIWGIPGHLRLIIGIHPETRELVYSDTWGRGHEYKALSWNEGRRLTFGMWTLDLPDS